MRGGVWQSEHRGGWARWRGALVISVTVLLIRLIVRVATASRPVETFEYETIAQNILAGYGYGMEYLGTWYRSFGSPPYSYLCAFIYGMFGNSHGAMLVVQAFCSAAAAIGCYGIGRWLFSPVVGWVSAALVALHPGLLFYDTHKIHPLGFDTMLVVLGVLVVLVLWDRPTRWVAAVAGGLHGLAILERSTLIGLAPLAVAVVWRVAKGRRAVQLLVAYGLALSTLPGVWVARNCVVYRQPVLLVTTTSSEVFWLGNNPLASGGAFAEKQPGVRMINVAPEALKQRVIGQDEFVQSRVFFQEAMLFIRDHPLDALRLYAKKLVIFAWFGRYSGYLYPAAYLMWYQRYYAAMLVLGLLGVLAVIRNGKAEQRREAAGVALFWASVALVQSLFYVEIRHRWSVEPLLLVFAAGGGFALYRFLEGVIRKKPSRDRSVVAQQEEHVALERLPAGERA